MWQMNITKYSKITQAALWVPMPQRPGSKCLTDRYQTRFAARLLPAPEFYNVETLRSVLFSTSMRIEISVYSNQSVFIYAPPQLCTWSARGYKRYIVLVLGR